MHRIRYTLFCNLFLSFLFFGLSTAAFAGEEDPESFSAIKGTVSTPEGKPVPNVAVEIGDPDKGTVTDGNGAFIIRRLQPGSYTVRIMLSGFATQEKQVTTVSGETSEVSFTMQLSNRQLREVVVSGHQSKLVAPASDYVARMPLKNLENPQVYTTITKELMAEQMVFSVDDAIKNAPGLTKMWEATGRSGDGGSFYNARGFILQSQLRNGIAGNVSSRVDAANLERIEVIKGPSATLFGSTLTSYGGLINRVTKKPYEKFGGEISLAAGSYSFSRISADINTPLGEDKRVLLRINTAYNYEGSFQDNGYNKSFVFAPSLSYQVNDRLSFNFDAEIFAGRNIGAQIFFFPYGLTVADLGADRADKLKVDYMRSFITGDISQVSRVSNYFGQMNYRLSDNWSTSTNVTVSHSFSDGPSPYFYLLGPDLISRNDQFTANSTMAQVEVQQNLNGTFKIGGLKNRFVAGLDYFYQNSDQFFSGGTLDTVMNHGDIPNYRNFNKENLEALYLTKGTDFIYPMKFKTSTYSIYASDVLNITDDLLVLAALRMDHFVNQGNYDVTTGTSAGAYDQTAFSPKFGVVYQPIRNRISLFANYQNGFKNQVGTDFNGKSFTPERANQVEGGVKFDVFNGRLSSTISYYNIKVDNVLRPDAGHPTFSVQDGTQVSRGIEAEVIASPVRGMNVIAGFGYNDSKLEKSTEDLEGRRPNTASSPYTANLWLSYRIPQGLVQGLGFGLGGNYASDNKIVNSSTLGVFTLPAYTIVNASVFYDRPRYRISAKVDNIGNQKYWIGYTTMNPQKLRSFVGSIAFKF